MEKKKKKKNQIKPILVFLTPPSPKISFKRNITDYLKQKGSSSLQKNKINSLKL